MGATGQTISIPDAYLDSRFDPSHDTATGVRQCVCIGRALVWGVVNPSLYARLPCFVRPHLLCLFVSCAPLMLCPPPPPPPPPPHTLSPGYRTKSILCVPIRDGSDAVVGVLQAINSVHGEFSELDKEIINVLASQAGVALTNARLYQESLRAKDKVRHGCRGQPVWLCFRGVRVCGRVRSVRRLVCVHEVGVWSRAGAYGS